LNKYHLWQEQKKYQKSPIFKNLKGKKKASEQTGFDSSETFTKPIQGRNYNLISIFSFGSFVCSEFE